MPASGTAILKSAGARALASASGYAELYSSGGCSCCDVCSPGNFYLLNFSSVAYPWPEGCLLASCNNSAAPFLYALPEATPTLLPDICIPSAGGYVYLAQGAVSTAASSLGGGNYTCGDCDGGLQYAKLTLIGESLEIILAGDFVAFSAQITGPGTFANQNPASTACKPYGQGGSVTVSTPSSVPTVLISSLPTAVTYAGSSGSKATGPPNAPPTCAESLAETGWADNYTLRTWACGDGLHCYAFSYTQADSAIYLSWGILPNAIPGQILTNGQFIFFSANGFVYIKTWDGNVTGTYNSLDPNAVPASVVFS